MELGALQPTTTTLLLNDWNRLVSLTVNRLPQHHRRSESGSGTPTGDVSLRANTYAYPSGRGSAGLFTFTGTAAWSPTHSTDWGGGGPTGLAAYYTGDATYAPSISIPDNGYSYARAEHHRFFSVLTATPQGNAIAFTGGPFGSFVYLRADVAGKSGYGTPTGSVTFTDTFGQIPGGNVFPLNGGNQINNGANTATPNGVLTFDTGTHTISASYSGDNSFNPSGTTQSNPSRSPPDSSLRCRQINLK